MTDKPSQPPSRASLDNMTKKELADYLWDEIQTSAELNSQLRALRAAQQPTSSEPPALLGIEWQVIHYARKLVADLEKNPSKWPFTQPLCDAVSRLDGVVTAIESTARYVSVPGEHKTDGTRADLLRQNQALREALTTLANEVNQCLQIIITNAGNWPIADEPYWRNPGERKEAVECQANIEAAVERAKKATWSALTQPPESAEVAPANMGDSDLRNWMIVFEDASMPPEVFTDEDAARKWFYRRKQNWNCRLFKEVERG
jgi:hypothetical protein